MRPEQLYELLFYFNLSHFYHLYGQSNAFPLLFPLFAFFLQFIYPIYFFFLFISLIFFSFILLKKLFSSIYLLLSPLSFIYYFFNFPSFCSGFSPSAFPSQAHTTCCLWSSWKQQDSNTACLRAQGFVSYKMLQRKCFSYFLKNVRRT